MKGKKLSLPFVTILVILFIIISANITSGTAGTVEVNVIASPGGNGGNGGGGGGSSGSGGVGGFSESTWTEETIEAGELIPEQPLIPEQLLDVKLEIEDKELYDPAELIARITFESFGRDPVLINLTYIILDEIREILFTETGNITVYTEKVLTKKFENLNLDTGKYSLVLKIKYYTNITDEFEQNFEIKREEIRVGLIPGVESIHIVISLLVLIAIAYIIKRTRERMKQKENSFPLVFSLLFILLLSLSALASQNVALSDQGTDVKNKTTGQLLSQGNLTIEVYDALTGGTLIYNESFTNAILNGSWNIMLGENISNPLSLEYGKMYYKDYKINGEDADFTNLAGGTVERQFFYSPLGDIEDADISDTTNMTLGEQITFTLSETIDNIIDGWIRITGNLNITGNIETPNNVTANYFIGNGSQLTDITCVAVDSINGTELADNITLDANMNILGGFNFSINNTNFYVDVSTGRIGIGTSSPSKMLHVSGLSNLSGVLVATMDNVATVSGEYAGTDLRLKARVGDYPDLIIDNVSGYVGIGTAEPSFTLDIQEPGEDSIHVMRVFQTNQNTNSRGLAVQLSETDPASTDYYISFIDGTETIEGKVRGNGTGGVFYDTASDARLKNNIRDSVRGLKDIMGIKVRDYEVGEDQLTRTGFVAQELFEIYPDIVYVGSNDVNDNGDLVDVWSLDYGKITPLVVKAIQELKAENDMLKQELCERDDSYSWC